MNYIDICQCARFALPMRAYCTVGEYTGHLHGTAVAVLYLYSTVVVVEMHAVQPVYIPCWNET